MSFEKVPAHEIKELLLQKASKVEVLCIVFCSQGSLHI